MKLINISEKFQNHPFFSHLKAFCSKKIRSKYALGPFLLSSFFSRKDSKRKAFKNEENRPS